jgi:type VI secretion system protein
MKLSLSIITTGVNSAQPLAKVIQQEKVTLGRGESNTFVLPDSHKWISNHHATIDYDAPDYFITDTSTNGLLINQATKPLGRDNRAKLNHGDQIHIGDYVIEVKLVDEVLPIIKSISDFGNNLTEDKSFNTSDDPFAELAAKAINNLSKENDEPLNWPDSAVKNHQTAIINNDFEHISPYKESLPIYDKLESVDLPPLQSSKTSSSIIPDNWDIDAPFEPISSHKESLPIDDKPEPDLASLQSSKASSGIISDKWDMDAPVKQVLEQHISPQPEPGRKSLSDLNLLPSHLPLPQLEKVESTLQPLGVSGDVIKNFLQGAGLENNRYAETLNAESFYIIGKMLKESIRGTQDVLIGRAKIKNEMHLDVTIIRAKENNPIKFSVNAEEALVKLLLNQDKGYLQPEVAIKEAFDDIKAHQYAVIAGMRTALLAVLKRFDPKKLEQRLQEDSPISAHIPIHKQMKLWDSFERLYKDIEQEAEDNFYHLFGEAFADTYEQQMRHVKKSTQDDIF